MSVSNMSSFSHQPDRKEKCQPGNNPHFTAKAKAQFSGSWEEQSSIQNCII